MNHGFVGSLYRDAVLIYSFHHSHDVLVIAVCEAGNGEEHNQAEQYKFPCHLFTPVLWRRLFPAEKIVLFLLFGSLGGTPRPERFHVLSLFIRQCW
jgi:hypothetical protein